MKKNVFLYIGLFWLVLILGFVAYKEMTLQTGEEVVLKTVPVDPRDLFRGDYVILRYDISDLDQFASDFKIGDKVYVTLDIVDGYGLASGVTLQKPTGIFLKGEVKDASEQTLHIDYGIESYFVPEGEGKDLERARNGELEVIIALDLNGNAVIKHLLYKGEIVTF